MTSHHNPKNQLLHASHSEAFVTSKNHKNMTKHVCDVVTICDEHVTRECSFPTLRWRVELRNNFQDNTKLCFQLKEVKISISEHHSIVRIMRSIRPRVSHRPHVPSPCCKQPQTRPQERSCEKTLACEDDAMNHSIKRYACKPDSNYTAHFLLVGESVNRLQAVNIMQKRRT